MSVTIGRYEVRVRGGYACFTRPEFKTERLSYEILTPSAARGVLEAILWKPAIFWHVKRIRLLKPVRFVQFKRNEVNSRIATPKAASASRSGVGIDDYFADEDRAQRNTVALRDVDYAVDAEMVMTSRAGSADNPRKFDEMFRRRLERGQFHMQPYLGAESSLRLLSPTPATHHRWSRSPVISGSCCMIFGTPRRGMKRFSFMLGWIRE